MRIVAWLSGVLAGLDPSPKPIDFAKPPVIVVHGLDGSEADMARLARALRADGREVFTPSLTPSNGDASIEDLSTQLAQFIETHVKRRPFDLIGYSMGGIVTRHYLQRGEGLPFVRHYITLSAPHHGTLLGLFRNGEGTRQMRRGSTFLAELNQNAEALENISFTSFWTPTDLIIIPASSSIMPEAENIRILGLGHFSCIMERRCIRRVIDVLNRDPAPSK